MWNLNILLLLFISCWAPSTATHGSHNWDFLIYTQHWPPAVCRVWQESSTTHTCTLPNKEDAWTVHGIWPSVPGSMGPAFCNRTWLFDPKEVQPIEAELEQSWVNIEKGTPLYDFWAHEWNKHGTCAAAIEPLNTQIKYFSKGLEWIQNYTMTNILAASNIIPSDDKTYTLQEIHNAIVTKLGTEPEIYCKHDKGVQYLWELRICFSKSLELIDCVSNKIPGLSLVTNCNAQGITYTESAKPPNKLLVQLFKLTTWLEWFTL